MDNCLFQQLCGAVLCTSCGAGELSVVVWCSRQCGLGYSQWLCGVAGSVGLRYSQRLFGWSEAL